jgi:uncharacterized protein (TIGR03084 family)
MSSPPADVLDALAAEQDELSTLLAGLSDADWARPSRCVGWTAADVVLHLAQTNEMAIGSARGVLADVLARLVGGAGPAASVDEGAELMVARERGQPVALLYERWRSGVDELRAALGACDPHQRVTWVAGELSVTTLATTRLAETWIHAGDVAAAVGVVTAPTDRLWHIARLAWRTLPYAFARAGRSLAGPVAFELRAPNGGEWVFAPDSAADPARVAPDTDDEPATVVRGPAEELCLVAARRLAPADTTLTGTGPDAEAVLALVRTYA